MKIENENSKIEILVDSVTIETKKQDNHTLEDLKQKIINNLYESDFFETHKEEIELLSIILENEKD